MAQPVDPADVRRLNTVLTLGKLFQVGEPLTMAQLVERTALSRRTVQLILDYLVREEWVREVDPEVARSVGRPPRSYEFRSDRTLIAALQIDTYQARAVVADVYGRIILRRSRPLTDQMQVRLTMDEGMDVLAEALSDQRVAGVRVRAIGFTGGGVFTSEGKVEHLVNAPEWSGIWPGRILEDRFQLPAVAENDANLAALAERWRGVAADHETFTWLLPGVRNGAGILINGSIHRGFQGAAGEIVHVESMGMTELHRHPLGGVSSPYPEERQAAFEIAEAARRGDVAAKALIDGFVEPVADVIRMFCWTVSPPLIVLGGETSQIADVLLAPLRMALRDADIPPVEIRFTSLPADGPLLGAVHQARAAAAGELSGAFTLPG